MPTTTWGAVPVWADGLCQRLRAYVVAQGLYPTAGVWVYLGRPEELCKAPPREQFLVIAPTALNPHQPSFEGGGLFTPRFDGLFTLTQFARLQLDRERQDTALLEHRSLGLSEAVRKLVAALQLWESADGTTGDSPLIEPGRLAGPVRFTPRAPPAGWAMAESTWELKFAGDLSRPGGG